MIQRIKLVKILVISTYVNVFNVSVNLAELIIVQFFDSAGDQRGVGTKSYYIWT